MIQNTTNFLDVPHDVQTEIIKYTKKRDVNSIVTHIGNMLLVSKEWNTSVKKLRYVQEIKEQKKAYLAFRVIYPTQSVAELFQMSAAQNLSLVFKFLMQIQINDCDLSRNMAASRAIIRDSIDIIKILLQDKRFDPSADNRKAMYHAVENNRLEILKILLQDKRVDPRVKGYLDQSALELVQYKPELLEVIQEAIKRRNCLVH